MGTKTSLTVIDTNVFIIDLRYKKDKNFEINKRFLDKVSNNSSGLTTLINLLEIIGILSFNLNEKQLEEFYKYFPKRYNIKVIPSLSLNSHLPEIGIESIIKLLKTKMSFGNALIMATINQYISDYFSFITWDKEHFQDKLDMTILTPDEYLSSYT